MTSLLLAEELAIPGRLQSTTFELCSGSLSAVIGPNGSGKTSLLRAAASIDRGASGSVSIGGETLTTVPPARRRRLLAYLPASREAHWPIAVRDVIALGLDRPNPGQIDALLGALELEELASRPVDRLSTGERARVLLARALAARPDVLLLDEPLANLDPYWVRRILVMLRVESERGAAVLVALHDLGQANAFDRLMLVDRGKIVADAVPEKVLTSAAFAKAFRLGAVELGLIPSAGPRSLR